MYRQLSTSDTICIDVYRCTYRCEGRPCHACRCVGGGGGVGCDKFGCACRCCRRCGRRLHQGICRVRCSCLHARTHKRRAHVRTHTHTHAHTHTRTHTHTHTHTYIHTAPHTHTHRSAYTYTDMPVLARLRVPRRGLVELGPRGVLGAR